MKLVLAATAALLLASPALARPMASMPGMSAKDHAAMSGKTVQGTGVVTAVDTKAGKVTLHHGPIAELSWPAMTMAFKASADVLKSAKVGQKVAFSLNPATSEVVAIQPQ
ncbi:copper-binding protein [Phenylobacterium hankyongense]|uniref:Copper-binding protein n=1 Tax=Phenylobacterium hankyongense TaxID=1813876 RepID=A0A328B170_9CAUL|nr:copper-binding protein [Phenylobacterium hankyongense]RAK60201.1 copper-binding protein [Phenylobacterium hankyongense]